ncbi:MAG: RNA methyltransferase [Ruminococcaceae bacterium]|nr:RNA methyltransferase [Oscillospiraceae bacterium]
MIITSRSNNIFKSIKKLNSKSQREKNGQYILEGLRIVKDAIENGGDIEYIVISSDYKGEYIDKVPVYEFDKKLFDEIKETQNSQGIIAVAKLKKNYFESSYLENKKTIVYLDGVSDPGNMGTIIRTCDAAGVDVIILSDNCTDIYNPKTIRSTMSSIFNIPICFDKNQDETVRILKENGFNIICTDLKATKYHYELDLTQKSVIVIGNEANGINDDLLNKADINTKIPIVGKCESLNAAVACSIMVYEALRQKSI